MRLLAAASFAILAACPCAAQSPRVDSIMSSLVNPRAPGAAVVVIQNGKVVHEKGYGLADVDANVPITPQSVFELGSVSKQFTAMAIMILAERGKLSYDDPLTKFFPEFPAYASKITVRHLLNHTSGLPDYMEVFQRRPAGISAEPTGREAVTMVAQIKEPLFAPGEKWEYSNSGYVVLAQIAEVAAGMPFPAFMKANVFDPLGMTSTVVSDVVRPKIANRAISYAPAAGAFRNIDYSPLNRIFGDGSVNTTVEDMVKWDQALYTDRLVKQATLDQAFTPGRLNSGAATTYGFGWTVTEQNGLRVLAHGGAWLGFRTAIVRVPSEHFSVVVLSNLATFNPSAAANQIARAYVDKLAKQSVIVDVATLSAYVGKYELGPGLVLDVTVDQSVLWVQMTGQGKVRMAAESSTRFYPVGIDGIAMTFNKDASGKVGSLTLHQNGDHPAKKLPN